MSRQFPISNGEKLEADRALKTKAHDTHLDLLGHAPQLTRIWGVFLAFVGLVTFAGLLSAQVARSDVVVLATTIMVLFAVGVALFARLRKVD